MAISSYSGARIVLVAGLMGLLAIGPADARPGGGRSSFGSRGGSTFSAPPSTATAPRTAQPMQRTETSPSVGSPRPSVAPAGAAQPRRFGLGTGLMAGLLGAGLIGMLSGHGFFGGLAGLASVMGLLFQVALIGGLIWLALRFFRRRSEPALAGAGAGYGRSSLTGDHAGGGTAGGFGARAATPVSRQPLEIGPADYAGFETLLSAVQSTYGREDMDGLRRVTTPEMARYLEDELSANRQEGVRNELSEPKLLQGDLAEAWREGGTDYATVAMRFALVDVTVDRATGRVVSGDRTTPVEATEIWTFRRDHGGEWRLSAIQQTG